MSIRILIASCQPGFISVAREALQEFDCELLLARDISLALYLAHKNIPDLILCQSSIAQGPNLDFVSEIRSDPDLQFIPIFLIADAAPINSQAAANTVAGHLSENIKTSELLAVISPYLQEHAIERLPQTPE